MMGASSVYSDQQQQANSIRMGSPIGLRDPSPAYRSSPNLLQQQQQHQQDLRMVAPSTTNSSSSIGSSSTSSLFGPSAIRFRSPSATQHNQQLQHGGGGGGVGASDQNFRDERYIYTVTPPILSQTYFSYGFPTFMHRSYISPFVCAPLHSTPFRRRICARRGGGIQ